MYVKTILKHLPIPSYMLNLNMSITNFTFYEQHSSEQLKNVIVSKQRPTKS